LADRTWNRNPAHRHQVGCGKMKANAEHEQNHADLCELPSDLAIGHESRSRWADAHSRDEIADQRRQT
jgi:hypothetical protein